MKRSFRFFFFTVLLTAFCKAQVPPQMLNNNGCGTGTPPPEWDNWMSNAVKSYIENNPNGKSLAATRIIPVVVHVIYFNETIGLYPNIDSNQIKSQIAVLNADFAGIGLNSNTVPPYFANKVHNTGIQFCLAQKDKSDQPMNPYGIERLSCQAFTWSNPNTPGLNLQNYFNTTIIPATIYPPDKYLNIWISDKPPGYPLNAFSTYPPSSGLTGVFGGTIGTITNDGIWVYTKAFGNTGCSGCLVGPTDKGRTTTHEVGHWLGLRHIWGDGNCLSDYASDTPPQKQANTGCPVSTPTDVCGVGQSPNGDMFMNFMDRTEDACMYMFTPEQGLRMQTALSQSPLRYQLGNHAKCHEPSGTPQTPVSGFNAGSIQCLQSAFTPVNNSYGFPPPTYLWSISPAASFFPNNTVTNPAITLSNMGTYTITLVATNSLSSSTSTLVVHGTSTCEPAPFCLDSLRMLKPVDSLKTYKAPVNTTLGCGATTNRGYLTGTNCYQDKEFAQYFYPSTYSTTPFPQVNSVIVLFDSIGTKATNPATPISCKVYSGNYSQGPVGYLNKQDEPLGTIASAPTATSITYLGAQNTAFVGTNKIRPFKFDMPNPVVILPANVGFYVSVTSPAANTGDSINIMSNSSYGTYNDSTTWYLSSTLTWNRLKTGRGSKVRLAMIPIITCSPVNGVKEEMSLFNSNVNIMPNPSDGKFNFVFTFPKQQELTLTVYNSLGQVVTSVKIKDVMNDVISVDLSSQPNGVYSAAISNGNERAIRKIIVSK